MSHAPSVTLCASDKDAPPGRALGVEGLFSSTSPLVLFTDHCSLPPDHVPLQKGSSISATQYFAPIVESGSQPDDRSALPGEASLTRVAIARREPKHVDRIYGRHGKRHGYAQSHGIG